MLTLFSARKSAGRHQDPHTKVVSAANGTKQHTGLVEERKVIWMLKNTPQMSVWSCCTSFKSSVLSGLLSAMTLYLEPKSLWTYRRARRKRGQAASRQELSPQEAQIRFIGLAKEQGEDDRAAAKRCFVCDWPQHGKLASPCSYRRVPILCTALLLLPGDYTVHLTGPDAARPAD